MLIAQLAQIRSEPDRLRREVEQELLLQKMTKNCKVESYNESRVMGVLEGWPY